MNGNVFQCHGESTDKQQFLKTMGVLGEHVNKTFTYPQDVASVCKAFKIVALVQPPDLSEDDYKNSMGKKMIWETSMKTYMKRVDLLESNTRAIYAIVWGQCSPMMQSKLESLEDYEARSDTCDCIWLIQEIQGITHRFEGTRNVFISLDDAWTAYYGFRQGQHQVLHDYLKDFQTKVQVLEHYGAVFGADGPHQESVMAQVKEASATVLTDVEYVKLAMGVARKKSIAISFLKRADKRRYGGLWIELENQFTRGLDHYPSDLTAAFNLLLNYKAVSTGPPGRRDPTNDEETSGMTFIQHSAPVPGTDGVTHATTKCYNCQSHGHYASACPVETETGVTMVQLGHEEDPYEDEDADYLSEFTFLHLEGHCFHQARNIIPDTWILLDSQSTVSVFKNRHLLTNIRASPNPLRVHTNGGVQFSTQMGTVRNFGDVWYNPESLANILSMAEVSKVCRITMDTFVTKAMHVHRADGSLMTFQEYSNGLYFYDAAARPNSTSTHQDDYLFLNTVASNKACYTRREIEGADKARALYRKLVYPSEPDYNTILQNNFVRNCPVTSDDAKRALRIYGPDVDVLKGKTVKQQNKGIPHYQPIQIPAPIIDRYHTCRLFVDIFWVNGNPFFHTISEWVKFRTVAAINNRSKKTLLTEIRAVINLYQTRGFTISRVEGDQEFNCIMHDLLPTQLNVADADDHVAEVERSIRTVKERVRCTVQGLPFRRIPRLMMRAAVEGAHKALNQFPARDGVSDVMSPLTIMTGRPGPDYNDLKIEFGSFAHVFEENDPTNTNKTRSTGAIALNATGNAQGGFHFMSLTTGKRISRQQWTDLPMPNGVIEAVEAMGAREKQPIMGNGGPAFEWSPGIAIVDPDGAPLIVDDPEDDPELPTHEDAIIEDVEDEIDDHGMDDIPEEYEEEDDVTAAEGAAEDDNPEEENPEGAEPDEFFPPHDDVEDARSANGDDEEDNTGDGITEHEADNNHGITEDQYMAEDAEPTEENEPVSARYNLRPNRERTYDKRFAHSMDNPASSQSYDAQFLQQGASVMPSLREAVEEMMSSGSQAEVMNYISGFIMTQMTAKAGIKKHGKVAIDALYQEFLQLHDLGVFEGQHVASLTKHQKRAALRAISVIKEKRCGKIKGRTVADGRPQRALYTKDETSSPTVSTDALMMSIMIDACERRDVATADVAGAYLHASMDDFTLLKLEGASVDIMCDVCEMYREFVTYENGKKVLYLRLLKALYGCVKSALLWYELFTGTLQGMGFELNPYDTCVANKMYDGKQCTIAWYVDDNKVSHIDPEIVTEVLDKIEERFGKMTITRGKKHVFLGMDITYLDNGTAQILMPEYLKEAIVDFGEKINKTATSPAKRDMYIVSGTSKRLGKARSEIFHSVVAKLLYVSHRSRMDIQLPIAFLCTRVSCCTEEDWKKLRRILEYLNGTLDHVRIIGADDLARMKTWVDASYAVHMDMRSHTGGVVSFGIGALMGKSWKQRLNVKSSTEAELVGASDYLPHAIWARKFMERQGYILSENTFYQDNQSAIRFQKNGRKSCGSNSRHIDIRYFFIKDRLETDKFTVEYCPTEQMLADFFTKPLQGNLFRRLREVIMGRKHIDTLKDFTSAKSQERVGEDNVPVENETKADVRRTDAKMFRPLTTRRIRTYAQVAKTQPRRE
jgi:hypothetical protein